MSATVVTVQEFNALAAEVKKLRKLLERGGAAAAIAGRAYLSPKKAAKYLGVRSDLVYAACESGELVAEKRSHGDRIFFRIAHADADRWYASRIRSGDNQ